MTSIIRYSGDTRSQDRATKRSSKSLWANVPRLRRTRSRAGTKEPKGKLKDPLLSLIHQAGTVGRALEEGRSEDLEGIYIR
ncbi:hypothetical protein N7491_006400 [Penicillium cf. griseofulvum]|uniref:Uncharacterized protein n=1 Tax=Penicillium cf. griseofulvum TaxID=2972120 RepID=A0A9W9IVA3_9EURO|nr:hypothetical protein N7472_010569 [Penicillium cf. griseofulvum]KAJ5429384.1 hypothetical protein N7491_006400 [Penicillium cf. griseofulvum]KAJ5436834.1 hypothetical protein N7445_007719 [Penicillium cf. griseofulvum]